MQYEGKVTLLETRIFPKLQAQYLAFLQLDPSPVLNQVTFTFKRIREQDDFYHLLLGKFCSETQDAISYYVYTALQGGSIMHRLTNDKRMMIACGDDETRSVIFKIECIDILGTAKEKEWFEKQNFKNTRCVRRKRSSTSG